MTRVFHICVVLIIAAFGASAQQRFVAHMTGQQEIPGNFSMAKGHCKIVLNAAETAISINCNYQDLGSRPTGFSVHGDAGVGQRAPVLFDLGPVYGMSGTTRSMSFNVSAAQVESMRRHKLYVSIRSSLLPRGEIRGQIKQVQTVSDNDGDGQSDPTVFRPSTSEFWSVHSSTGKVGRVIYGGGASDTFLNDTGDFDGDGRFDPLLLTIAGNEIVWKIQESDSKLIRTETWGSSNDALAIADYDGDGMLDVAVFRRATGHFLVLESSTGDSRTHQWGKAGDYPAVGDYDGDGRADLTTVRIEGADFVWYIKSSRTGTTRREVFGNSATDGFTYFSPFDWDGDGRQDIRVSRNSATRENLILRSSDGKTETIKFGLGSDTHFFGDYDGDGRTDIVARRRLRGHYLWQIFRSSDSQIEYSTWGIAPYEAVGADRPEGSSPGYQAGL